MGKEKRFSEEMLCVALLVGVAFGVVAGVAIYASAYPIFQSEEWASWGSALGSSFAAIVALWLGLSERRQSKRERREAARFYLGSRQARLASLRSDVLMLIIDTESLNYDGVPWPFQESQNNITKIVEEVTALITPEAALSFPAAASTLIRICDEMGSASEHLNRPNMKQFVYAAGRAEKLMAKFSTYKFMAG